MGKKHQPGNEHVAVARALDLPISTKHSVEISRYLRYKNTTLAKKFLEGVIRIKVPVPYKRHTKDLGHKKGIGSGRYPEKAAREFLKLIKSVEANAQVKGLNMSALKITKIVANKAPIPFSGGRQRRATKRAHLEIEVTEMSGKGAAKKEGSAHKSTDKKHPEIIREPSPAELLRMAQSKAAVFNNSEKERVEIHKVENLFGELQKKGTLRK